jgi:small nuclear ribonucleoprotein (snRNP)-like protein
VSSSDSEFNVEEDVPDIIPSASKKSAGNKIPQNVTDVPIDKVSFHYLENTQRWKYIFHGRLALERDLGKEALECEVVMNLIKKAGLLKIVCNYGDCYEKLVKEFLVNILGDCDNPLRNEYQKVFVRGECVKFSPTIINKLLGIDETAILELEVSDNQVCKEITDNQVKVWPKKGKIFSGKLPVKYAILNRIRAVNWVLNTHA